MPHTWFPFNQTWSRQLLDFLLLCSYFLTFPNPCHCLIFFPFYHIVHLEHNLNCKSLKIFQSFKKQQPFTAYFNPPQALGSQRWGPCCPVLKCLFTCPSPTCSLSSWALSVRWQRAALFPWAKWWDLSADPSDLHNEQLSVCLLHDEWNICSTCPRAHLFICPPWSGPTWATCALWYEPVRRQVFIVKINEVNSLQIKTIY